MAIFKSWFTKMIDAVKMDDLDDLLLSQLRDLYDAEKQLITALPRMERAASTDVLQAAFRNHWEETKLHQQRLEQVFGWLSVQPDCETCEAMQALLTESEQAITLECDLNLKDAALIAACQRIEHYEIASYGCARTFAGHLGHIEVVRILQTTLDEERRADQSLTDIAENYVNLHAAHHRGVAY